MINSDIINITFKCGYCEKEFTKNRHNINVDARMNTWGTKEIGLIESKCPHCNNIVTVEFK